MFGVELKNVEKIYKSKNQSVIGVKSISLTADKHKTLSIVGPSGCGKSTTLKIIVGIETPTTGTVYINNECVNKQQPQNRKIALCFQNYALYKHLTVYDNIALGLKLRQTPNIKENITKIAEQLQISDLLPRYPDTLSGGQKQRTALARAIVRKPEVLLLDEPLSSLDAQLRTQMRTEIKAIQAQNNITTIFVTHDQAEACALGHKLAVMHNGLIEQIDTPENVYNHPATLWVAQFIGNPAINTWDVRVSSINGTWLAHWGSQSIEIPAHIGKYGVTKDFVTIGIRPEHIAPDPMGIPGNIKTVEFLGSMNLIQCNIEGISFRIQCQDPAAKSFAFSKNATTNTLPNVQSPAATCRGNRLNSDMTKANIGR
jgi:multiple sugar transport system ATP-binding protein